MATKTPPTHPTTPSNLSFISNASTTSLISNSTTDNDHHQSLSIKSTTSQSVPPKRNSNPPGKNPQLTPIASTPDTPTYDIINDYKKKKRSSKKKWRRTFSGGNLKNSARHLSRHSSKLSMKIKNKQSSNDDDDVIKTKIQLKSCKHDVNDMLNISKKLYESQQEHLKKMKLFENTIHSSINLGRNRGKTNSHYFGQYMKMMANNMHKIHDMYSQYSFDLRNNILLPFDNFMNDDDLQKCINLKIEYNTKKVTSDNKGDSKSKLEMESIRYTFVSAVNELFKKRENTLLNTLIKYNESMLNFSQKRSLLLNDKRVINGYDEAKSANQLFKEKMKNEIVNINTDQQFNEYISTVIDDNNKYNKDNPIKPTKYMLILFHRKKFPPSQKFLDECFVTLCDKYNKDVNSLDNNLINIMKFIVVTHECKMTLQKYNVDAFPTLIPFIKDKPSIVYKYIIGNSEQTRDELKFIVDKLSQKVLNNKIRRNAVNPSMFDLECMSDDDDNKDDNNLNDNDDNKSDNDDNNDDNDDK